MHTRVKRESKDTVCPSVHLPKEGKLEGGMPAMGSPSLKNASHPSSISTNTPTLLPFDGLVDINRKRKK